jgi:hypothetical protein
MFRVSDFTEEFRRRPFEPFRIHVSDGSTYEVRHPELVMVSPSRVLIFMPLADQPYPAFERFDSIALVHITRLEPVDGTPSVQGNGPG